MNMLKKNKICSRCIMDTTDEEIFFDDAGFCNHCNNAIERLAKIPSNKSEKSRLLNKYIDKIKSERKTNDGYDCLIGLSGGLDSSYLAYKVIELGLKPLAVHVDNGWNTELSVRNIKNLVLKLDIDLITNVLDWTMFRDLQLCFLKSSLANCEAPTDHAITATLFTVARKNNLKYIISGGNLASESIMPKSWGHYNQDLKLLKSVHKRFGKKKINNFPKISLIDYLINVFIFGIRQIPLLNLLDYDKEKSLKILKKNIDFVPYKLKHGESIWTKFFQNYYLPKKFGIDKRKAHFSSLICSNQLSRDEALIRLKEPLYSSKELENDLSFILKKLDLSKECFKKILKNENKHAWDYPSNYFLFKNLEFLKNHFRDLATKV